MADPAFHRLDVVLAGTIGFTTGNVALETSALTSLATQFSLYATDPQTVAFLQQYWQAVGGDPDAMYALGNLYFNGQGVTQDYGKAMSWYKKAANAGNDNAMYGVGFLYNNGQGVAQDYGRAMAWYKKAAALNNFNAMTAIAIRYDRGEGVPQDYAQAMTWYQKACTLTAKG